MNWKKVWDLFLKRGFKFRFKFPWLGEKDLADPVNPYEQDKSNAMDDIMESLNREYECKECGKKKKQRYICRCTNCGHFVCNTCYTIIGKKVWCPECLKKRKNKIS